VNNPPYLNIQALPQSAKQVVYRFYQDLGKEFPEKKDSFAALIDYMNLTDKSDQLLSFFVMTKHIDRIRGENYLEIFPELECLNIK